MEEFMKPLKVVESGTFHTSWGKQITDLSEYVKTWLEEHVDDEVSIHVGCDSHVGARIKYVTSLCFLREKKGGHIINKNDYCSKDLTINERLMNEIQFSLMVAESLKELGLEITIHVDYNPNPKFKSNELYATGLSTGTWFGYKTVGKPYAWCSSKAADHSTRTKRLNRKAKRKHSKDRKKLSNKAA